MSTQDARSLPSHTQSALRERAIKLFQDGVKQVDIAEKLGVTRQAVGKWVKAYKTGGRAALKPKIHGRPKGIVLAPWQAAQIVKQIRNYCPDELGLPFFLWTRDAVAMLIKSKFGITFSKWTVGRYLKRWGFSSQKPCRRAIEQNPKSIEKWLTISYPSIRKRAKREGSEILWGDEMGLRSDHTTGKSYGIRGKTPVVRRTGKRFSCNMISAISNKGTLRFMVFRDSFKVDLFIEFLRRLIRQMNRKVFLIVDQHPVHKAMKVKAWLKMHEKDIEIFYLPGYCPELNPDEFLNQDVKSQALKSRRPSSQDELVESVISHLRKRQKQPELVSKFVSHVHSSYAI